MYTFPMAKLSNFKYCIMVLEKEMFFRQFNLVAKKRVTDDGMV